MERRLPVRSISILVSRSGSLSPDRQYLWLLGRSPDLAQEVREEYLSEAKRQGFDLTKLIVPKHTGRVVTDEMVED